MKLTIKIKLVMLCVLGLSLVAAVLLVGVYFNGKMDKAHTEQVDIFRAVEQVQQARIAEKAYLQFYKPEFVQERAEHSKQAREAFIDVAIRGGVDVDALKSQLEEYDSAFSELTELVFKNEVLGQKMDSVLEEITDLVAGVEDEIQSQLFDLQMEGETLPDAENNLLSLTRDGKILALTMKNSYRAFLLSGDKIHLRMLKKYIDKNGAVTLSGLSQFSAQTGNASFVSAAAGFKAGIKQGEDLLLKSQGLFDQEQGAGENLNIIGDALVVQAEELLTQASQKGEQSRSTAITA
ncbi:MAG: hypothetical protein L3J63_03620, partial [Geopsychrobacter sp.]|nr:hypothetical protein [Geopsychrobacter sp.]